VAGTMPMLRRTFAFTILVAAAASGWGATAAAQSYLLQLQSGKRLQSRELSGWNTARPAPLVDGKPAATGSDPLRWCFNQRARIPPVQAAAGGYIELAGGDRVPGRVVGFVPATAAPSPTAAHLLVQCPDLFAAPGSAERLTLRVQPAWIRRISFKPHSQRRFTAAHVFTVDGRQLAFRKLRWNADSVQILTSDGPQTIALAAIEEVHFQAPTPQTPTPQTPDVNSGLGQAANETISVETVQGLIVTADAKTFAAAGHSNDEERARTLDQIARLKVRIKDLASRITKVRVTNSKRLVALQQRTANADQRLVVALERIEKSTTPNTVQKKNTLISAAKKAHAASKKKLERSAAMYELSLTKHLKNYKQQKQHLESKVEEYSRNLAADEETGDPRTWYHQIDPAWSLDPVWIKFSDIRSRLTFQPRELPLTRLAPVQEVRKSTFGKGYGWRRNRNVLDMPLRSINRNYGWGLGVHAYSELHFQLPASARQFRTLVALDDTARDGGCIQAAVYLNTVDGKPLFESPLLTAEDRICDTGNLPLPAAGNDSRRLILVIRQAHQNRPAGALPFDILDHANWLEPLLTLADDVQP